MGQPGAGDERLNEGHVNAMKTALITGIDGQDGSYLAELLLSKGYRVIGWIPEVIQVNRNIEGFRDQIELICGSLSDQEALNQLVTDYQPDEVYNLAAPSSPIASWIDPIMVGEMAALGPNRLLEAIRCCCPGARFYQASSSEMFGKPLTAPQNETTPFHPRNPYGAAKLYAHFMTVNYRENYGLYAVSGILFNHESPRRGLNYVTRKITHSAVMIKQGAATELRLGNLDARRDWGFAGDYVEAIWLMLQQELPTDFVIGTGEVHSVREFCEKVFGMLDLDCEKYVIQDASLLRTAEEVDLVADSTLAHQQLHWKPSVSLDQMIQCMIEAEFQHFQNLSK